MNFDQFPPRRPDLDIRLLMERGRELERQQRRQMAMLTVYLKQIETASAVCRFLNSPEAAKVFAPEKIESLLARKSRQIQEAREAIKKLMRKKDNDDDLRGGSPLLPVPVGGPTSGSGSMTLSTTTELNVKTQIGALFDESETTVKDCFPSDKAA